MDSTESHKGTVETELWLLAVVLIGCSALAFTLGYFANSNSLHKTQPVTRSPTTAAPFAFACDHGAKIYTTPQGGIAVFPGGKDCP